MRKASDCIVIMKCVNIINNCIIAFKEYCNIVNIYSLDFMLYKKIYLYYLTLLDVSFVNISI